MRPDGFVAVYELLNSPSFRNVSFDLLQDIVNNDAKQRYLLIQEPAAPETQSKTTATQWFIRANQGHSIALDNQALYTRITDPADLPEVVVHGTYEKCWPAIERQGLKKMSRTHIHFAPGFVGQRGVISGMRANCEVFIFIDAKRAMQDGIQFYRSHNQVILSDGIDGVILPKYFKEVKRRSELNL
ncbi:tRNA 2'-phosphotransferase [Dispira parvispora]|uniref:2'-phosphotransferase n=1 Tax=Dispira parvispora TaxID=1520584 RepID=A0A9W8AN68_9FUNG|nr:tRNA 2'-phosphotransferase [Dispira parvispora]